MRIIFLTGKRFYEWSRFSNDLAIGPWKCWLLFFLPYTWTPTPLPASPLSPLNLPPGDFIMGLLWFSMENSCENIFCGYRICLQKSVFAISFQQLNVCAWQSFFSSLCSIGHFKEEGCISMYFIWDNLLARCWYGAPKSSISNPSNYIQLTVYLGNLSIWMLVQTWPSFWEGVARALMQVSVKARLVNKPEWIRTEEMHPFSIALLPSQIYLWNTLKCWPFCIPFSWVLERVLAIFPKVGTDKSDLGPWLSNYKTKKRWLLWSVGVILTIWKLVQRLTYELGIYQFKCNYLNQVPLVLNILQADLLHRWGSDVFLVTFCYILGYLVTVSKPATH